jgi:tetratricopeptide (TPR) repeat protein
VAGTTKEELEARFDAALRLRDADDYKAAAVELETLVSDLYQADYKGRTLLLTHSLMQLGYMHDKLGDHVQREVRFREAVELSPRSELASLGWFHSLLALRRTREAYAEVVRLLTVRDSPEYRELLEGDGGDLAPRLRPVRDLIARALELAAMYRRRN